MRKLLFTLTIFCSFGFFATTAFASTQVFIGSTLTNLANTTVNLGLNLANSTGGSTNASLNGVFPIQGSFSNLYAYAGTPPTGTQTWTVTLFDQTTGKSVSCTINSSSPINANGAATCNDTTDSFTNTAGDINYIRFTAANTPNASRLYYTIQFEPSSANQTALLFHSDTSTMSTTLQNNTTIGSWSGVCNGACLTMIPETGTFKDFYIAITTGITSGSYTFGLTNTTQGANSSIFCLITSATCNDLTDTYVGAAAGDLMVASDTPQTPSAARAMAGGVGFTPTTAGDFDFVSDGGADSAAATRYFPFVAGSVASNVLEASSSQYVDAMTVTNMYVSTQNSPGAGKTRTFTLDKNGTPTVFTCTQSGTPASTCSFSGSVSVAQGDLLDVSDTETSGATANSHVGLAFVANTSSTPPPTTIGPSIFSIIGALLKIIGGQLILR